MIIQLQRCKCGCSCAWYERTYGSVPRRHNSIHSYFGTLRTRVPKLHTPQHLNPRKETHPRGPDFPNIQKPPENSRRKMRHMKQATHSGLTNISRHHTNLVARDWESPVVEKPQKRPGRFGLCRESN